MDGDGVGGGAGGVAGAGAGEGAGGVAVTGAGAAGGGVGLVGDGGIASFVAGGSCGGGGEKTFFNWAQPTVPAAMKTTTPSSHLIRTQEFPSPLEVRAVRKLGLPHGQSDAHGCPLPELGGDVDAAIVQLNDTID